MKLKRICKLEYDDKDQAIIPRPWAMRYDVYFIDNEDWLCIDDDDYTQDKFEARLKERMKNRPEDAVVMSYHIMPTIPVKYIKLEFTITNDGDVVFK